MKLRPRLVGLLAVMAASIAFAMFDRDAQVAAPSAQPMPTPRKVDTSRELRSVTPAAQKPKEAPARDTEPPATDLFAAKSWYVAPPPPPPSKPEAPPLPFTVTGSMRDGDDITLFLNQGERNFIVRTGDVVAGSYRLDDIVDGRAEFTYLPLKQQQTLQIGKIN